MEMLELPSCGIGSNVRGGTTGEEGAESEIVDVERGEGGEGDDEVNCGIWILLLPI